jgi:hypothetical protein
MSHHRKTTEAVSPSLSSRYIEPLYRYIRRIDANSPCNGITEEDLGVLEYLPIAAAALFACPELVEVAPPSHGSYNSSIASNLFNYTNVYNVYQHLSHNNQHLLAFGLAKSLLFTFNYFQYKTLDMKVILNHLNATVGNSSKTNNSSSSSSNSATLNYQAKKASILEDYRVFIEIYVKISAQIILTVHTTAINCLENPSSASSAANTVGSLDYTHISYGSLYLQLFDFLDFCHHCVGDARQILEKYLMSYDLIQTSFNNLALGRYFISDKLEKIPVPSKNYTSLLQQQQGAQMTATATATSGGAMY